VKQASELPAGFRSVCALPETDRRGLPVPRSERQGNVRDAADIHTVRSNTPSSGTRSAHDPRQALRRGNLDAAQSRLL